MNTTTTTKTRSKGDFKARQKYEGFLFCWFVRFKKEKKTIVHPNWGIIILRGRYFTKTTDLITFMYAFAYQKWLLKIKNKHLWVSNRGGYYGLTYFECSMKNSQEDCVFLLYAISKCRCDRAHFDGPVVFDFLMKNTSECAQRNKVWKINKLCGIRSHIFRYATTWNLIESKRLFTKSPSPNFVL